MKLIPNFQEKGSEQLLQPYIYVQYNLERSHNLSYQLQGSINAIEAALCMYIETDKLSSCSTAATVWYYASTCITLKQKMALRKSLRS